MNKVSALVLAAGMSTRMGKHKQLLPYKGTTILSYILRQIKASFIDEISLVLGHNAEELKEETKPYKPSIVYNPNYKQGMHTSVMAGVRSIQDKSSDFMIFLGDQPQISAELINAIMEMSKKTKQGIIIPSFNNRRGHPVLFKSGYRPQLLSLPEDQGLKAVIQKNKSDIHYLVVNDSSILSDIDTPEDYATLLQ